MTKNPKSEGALSNKGGESDSYSNEEIARRRDEALLRALSTPPKRHSEMKLGKITAKKKATSKSARKKPNG